MRMRCAEGTMKLVRATCECGFSTRKARAGYHFHQWWFPVLNSEDGVLTDVSRSLPGDQVSQIQLSKVPAADLHVPFIESVICELIDQFASRPESAFNPEIGASFRCPQCEQEKLSLAQVDVIADCKSGCGHEYRWDDSEQQGCPKCEHRPHRFQVDFEPRLKSLPRTTSFCPCSSTLESAIHSDAFCPKCGGLPDAYLVNEASYCGMHHTRLQTYRLPRNWLFILTSSRWVGDRFPNAKLWGDALDNDAIDGLFCEQCEETHQLWIHENPSP